jgi:hypothetical protein
MLSFYPRGITGFLVQGRPGKGLSVFVIDGKVYFSSKNLSKNISFNSD